LRSVEILGSSWNCLDFLRRSADFGLGESRV